MRLLAFVLAGTAVFAAAPALAGTNAAGHTPQKKKVEVYDNYYGPKKLTVNPKSRITWQWSEDSADVHDVKLISGARRASRSSRPSRDRRATRTERR